MKKYLNVKKKSLKKQLGLNAQIKGKVGLFLVRARILEASEGNKYIRVRKNKIHLNDKRYHEKSQEGNDGFRKK